MTRPVTMIEPGTVKLERLLPGPVERVWAYITESDKRAPLELPFPLLRERTYGDTRIAVHRHG